jgi:uncharacterized protein YijF (DUF1287 family)
MLASTGAVDFLAHAKQQIGVVNTYDTTNGYYGNGGYPPPDTGVCSDVIWRAYRAFGKDFRTDILAHIARNPSMYPAAGDTNISYRRVKNIYTYLLNTAKVHTNILTPYDVENLQQWQAGDIVIFDEMKTTHLWHIGIVADTRRADGVPYMLDNHGYGTHISITPLDWPTAIVGHFRVF